MRHTSRHTMTDGLYVVYSPGTKQRPRSADFIDGVLYISGSPPSGFAGEDLDALFSTGYRVDGPLDVPTEGMDQ